MLQEIWHKDYSHVVVPEPWDLDDDLVEWHNGYKQR